MKRLFVLISFFVAIIFPRQDLSAQSNSSSFSANNDFFLNVLYNPQFSIGDFLTIGLNSKNLHLYDLSFYMSNTSAKNKCREQNIDLTTAYNRVRKAWDILLEVDRVNIDEYNTHYSSHNIMANQHKTNSQIKRKLDVVPLRIQVQSSYTQQVFKPKEATITTGSSSYTSHSFDCQSIFLSDRKNFVVINWGGNELTLQKRNGDTYSASKSISGKNVSITAYRSAQTNSIYLVTVVQRQGSETVRINFK